MTRWQHALGIVAVVGSVALLWWTNGQYLVTNVGDSIPSGQYLCQRVAPDAPVWPGQTVLFTWPPSIQAQLADVRGLNLRLPSLKYVAAVAPAEVCWDSTQMVVNQAHTWPLALQATSATLPRQGGCLTVQPDEVLLVGTHPLSFDSRYVGPLERSLVQATCWKVW